VLAVDFAELPQARKSLFGRFHRHGHVKLEDIQALLSEAGLRTAASGDIGFANMRFVLAEAGGDGSPPLRIDPTQPKQTREG
jgi:hypothetical protein